MKPAKRLEQLLFNQFNFTYVRTSLRSVTAFALLVTITGSVSAQSQGPQLETPSHPLSQINPIDIPLNMSNENVINVSGLSFNPGASSKDELDLNNNQVRNVSSLSFKDVQDGFYIDGYDISSQGGGNFLRLKPGEDQLLIGGNDGTELNLSGNNLTTPNNIKTGGEPVKIRDSTNGEDILRAQEGGSVELPNGPLRAFSNNITGDEGKIGLGSDPEGVFLRADTGSVFLRRGSTDALRAVENNRVEIPSGNLDMSGNNITNVDTIDGEVTLNSSVNITGELNVSSGLDLEDNGIDDVRSVDGGGDAIQFQDTVNLDENPVLNVDNLRDNSGTDTIRFDGSSNVEIPNGNLSVTNQFASASAQTGAIRLPNSAFVTARDSSDTSDISIIGTTQTDDVEVGAGATNEVNFESSINLSSNDITGVGGTNPAESGAVRISNAESINFRSSEDDSDFGIAGTTEEAIEVRNTAGDDTARFKDNSNVEIPNGNLGVGRSPVAKLDLGLSNSGRVQVAASGQAAAEVRNTAGNLTLNGTRVGIEDSTGEVVRVAGGRVGVGSTNPSEAVEIASGNLRLTNGDVQLNGNDLVSNVEDNTSVETEKSLVIGGDTDSDDTGQVAIQTRGNSRVFVTNSGRVEIQDNNLDLQGNRIVDSTNSNKVFVGDGSNDNVRLETGGKDVDVPTGDVDLSGGNVKQVNRVSFSNNEEIEEKNGDLCIGDRCA